VDHKELEKKIDRALLITEDQLKVARAKARGEKVEYSYTWRERKQALHFILRHALGAPKTIK
jgi:hypothetical protein